jgi:hypothetical protein
MSYMEFMGRFLHFNIIIHIISTVLDEMLTNYIFLMESITSRYLRNVISRHNNVYTCALKPFSISDL